MDIELMSLVEIAIEIQENEEKTTFLEHYNKVCEKKGFNEEEKRAHIAQFYTDITACGDFIYCGDDLWDLKRNQKLDALEKEFQSEHVGFDESEEKETRKPKRKSSKRAPKTPLELEEEENREEIDSEDQAYETQMTYDDDYDLNDEDDDYSRYEKDFDSELDEDDEKSDYDDDDDFDEDKYNSIMDEYENQYDD